MYTSPAPPLWNSTTRTSSDQGERGGTFLTSLLGCVARPIIALPGPFAFPFAFRWRSRGAEGPRTISHPGIMAGPYRSSPGSRRSPGPDLVFGFLGREPARATCVRADPDWLGNARLRLRPALSGRVDPALSPRGSPSLRAGWALHARGRVRGPDRFDPGLSPVPPRVDGSFYVDLRRGPWSVRRGALSASRRLHWPSVIAHCPLFSRRSPLPPDSMATDY